MTSSIAALKEIYLNMPGALLEYQGQSQFHALQQMAAQQQHAAAIAQVQSPFAAGLSGLCGLQQPGQAPKEYKLTEAADEGLTPEDLKALFDNQSRLYDETGTASIDWGNRTLHESKQEEPMWSFYTSMKDYVKRHGDIIFTVIFLAILDKTFFGGAIKKALQSLVEKMIAKADLHLDKPVIEAK